MSVRQEPVFLSLLAQGGNTGLWSYRPDTQQLEADANTCQLMQCPAASPLPLAQWLAGVQAEDRVLLAQDVQAAITGQASFARTIGLRGAGDAGHLSVRGRWCAGSEAGAGSLLGVVERCRLSTQRVPVTAQRAEAAKTMLLSSVSHELRTPLHTMLGHVRLMRKKASGEDLQQLMVVERSSSHLLRLIEDLLEYNHATLAPEHLKPDVVGMESFLASLQLIGSAATADSDNQFFTQTGAGLPSSMVVDEARLTQVLRILMDNACKYTRAGALLFTLSCEGDRRTVDGTERCALRFSVEDTGRGIDSDDVGHLFEPLQRGSNAADLPGLGLGLAIAAHWIERMGGKIAVETSLGFGSYFSFALDLGVCFDAAPHASEMLRQSPHVPPSPQATLRLHPLPQEDLRTLGELIHMGRLGRLRDWALSVDRRYPQHRVATAWVVELAGNADLDALGKLHTRWAALGCQFG